MPRALYGDYLQALLFWQAQPLSGPDRVRIDVIDDEVLDVIPGDDGVEVALRSQGLIQATQVLLATGNLAPLFQFYR